MIENNPMKKRTTPTIMKPTRWSWSIFNGDGLTVLAGEIVTEFYSWLNTK